MCLQLCAQLFAVQALPRCKDGDLTITVDNKMELYIDGDLVSSGLPNKDGWPAADTVHVQAGASIIGVKGEDISVVAGILASGANARTDGSWKCTTTFHEGWAGVRYDDSDWPAATVIDSHGVSPWGIIVGIDSEAKWIWTPNHQYGPDSDKIVYCRKRRGIYLSV